MKTCEHFDTLLHTLTRANVAKPLTVIIDETEFYALQLENGQVIVPFGSFCEVYDKCEYTVKEGGTLC